SIGLVASRQAQAHPATATAPTCRELPQSGWHSHLVSMQRRTRLRRCDRRQSPAATDHGIPADALTNAMPLLYSCPTGAARVRSGLAPAANPAQDTMHYVQDPQLTADSRELGASEWRGPQAYARARHREGPVCPFAGM